MTKDLPTSCMNPGQGLQAPSEPYIIMNLEAPLYPMGHVIMENRLAHQSDGDIL